jgi:energy-coupling factor transport system substrate-specific component
MLEAKEDRMATLTGRVRRASAWAVGTREVVFMAIGAALYGVLGWATSLLKIPGPFNSQIRPGVVIPMFFGAIFGPWVGFFTGFVGNVIIDLLSGYGFSWNWSLGNGLLGLISGIAFARARGEDLPSLREVLTWAAVGTLLAFLFSSVTDIWVYQTEPGMVPLQYVQVIIPNLIAGAVLLPILYLAYKQVQERSGR